MFGYHHLLLVPGRGQEVNTDKPKFLSDSWLIL